MDKKLAGLLGAAALSTVASAQAAPVQSTQPAPAMSYRDLLAPIPDALPMLKADDARLAQQPAAERLAQIHVELGHHHHHHHHHHRVIVTPPRRVFTHHHHHHHHHHRVIIER